MGAQAVRLSNGDIDNALKNKDFEVQFQPIFDLGNGALARMETFVRWRHPSLGVLPPGAFISFFESQGRMSELTRYVLGEALKTYTGWRGASAPGFSINLALSDLSDEAFTSHFVKLLRDHNFPADLVTLECPMPSVDAELEVSAGHFARLGETGARLAIEVRGRANDLLRNIDPFPFDEIKTGGSSILRFARTVRGPGLSAISDLLDIANNANAVITAVGVEDQASLAALRGLGFTAAQGNHLGKVGILDEFHPSKVNDVRKLLGLAPLTADSLNALFRTEAPAPIVSELETLEVVETPASEPLDEQSTESSSNDQTSEEKSSAKQEAGDDDERKAKAREKAKALVLAKRAKARAARKAAAIARAKAKAAEGKEETAEESTTDDKPAVLQPHALQERLNLEFANPSASKDSPPTTASGPEETPPQAPAQSVTIAEEEAQQRKDKLSVPEKVAASAGSRPSPAASVPTPPASKASPPQTEKPAEKRALQLAVGEVHAYFQPGIFVGGPAFDPNLQTSATKASQALNETISTVSLTPDVIEEVTTLADNVSNVSTPAEEPSDASPSTDNDAEQDATQSAQTLPTEQENLDAVGDLHTDVPTPLEKRQPRKRKSFLTRTVFPYPTHFWPKGWKRSYQRMTKKRTDSMPESTTETVQAAE